MGICDACLLGARAHVQCGRKPHGIQGGKRYDGDDTPRFVCEDHVALQCEDGRIHEAVPDLETHDRHLQYPADAG